MDRRPAGFASAFRNYEDFQPSSSLVQEEKSDTLIINLPAGFRKEQIRVQIDGFGTLKISGERPLGDNKWSRFRKDYRTPTNCNTSEIRAKFENGVLHIVMPKTVTTTTTSTTPKPPTRPEPIAPPPSTTTPTNQTPPSQTDSSKIPTPPPPPPPVVLPPPSQKPVATESSKISPTKPLVGAPPSQKPTLTTEATVPAPPPRTTETQPSSPSQISSAASPTTTPKTKVTADDMESKTDHLHKDNNPLEKKKKKVTMNSTHGYIEDEWNKHVAKGQNTEKEYGSGGVGKMKMHESTGENKVSHSGGGGGGGGGGSTNTGIRDKASSIFEDYKKKIEGFMMELKKKSSTTASSSSTSNDDNRSELLVNMAVASLVVVALGAYVTWSFKSSWNKHA